MEQTHPQKPTTSAASTAASSPHARHGAGHGAEGEVVIKIII